MTPSTLGPASGGVVGNVQGLTPDTVTALPSIVEGEQTLGGNHNEDSNNKLSASEAALAAGAVFEKNIAVQSAVMESLGAKADTTGGEAAVATGEGGEKDTSSTYAPTVNLGPRMASARKPSSESAAKAMTLLPRKSPSQEGKEGEKGAAENESPVVPRNLGDALDKGKKLSTSNGMSQPPLTTINSPSPNSFGKINISPLRSSARIKIKREMSPPRSQTTSALEASTPAAAPSSARCSSTLADVSKAELLSPCGMFLSPRTPRLAGVDRDAAAKASALTPSNFASDFGKGHKMSETFDASNVFAWLHSPGQGLFSPSGGLTTLSVTNTPRGMYGFSGAGGKTPFTPSTHLAPHARLAPSTNASSYLFSEAAALPPSGSEHAAATAVQQAVGGGGGAPSSPKPQESSSMICISPLASQKTAAAASTAAASVSSASKSKRESKPAHSAPNTPMSIDFREVFASPRLPTPRMSRTTGALPAGSTGKDGSMTHPSPVVSAMQRRIMEDEDLNALLKLAETTTPGGRPISFMSPLLTTNLRHITHGSKST